MRELALLLLDDDHGIPVAAWSILCSLLEESGDCEDIIEAVTGADDRVFIPAGVF